MDKITRLKNAIEDSGLSYVELERRTGIPKSSIQRYVSGKTKKVPMDAMEALARTVGIAPEYVMGWEENTAIKIPNNILPMPKMRKIPLLGTIACGKPILATENIECEVDIPENINADFALRCQGDSMINARIFDGDIVYIRQQETVENGEIAAILVGDEATLKRIQLFPDHIVLNPENPMYKPLVYWEEDMNCVRILGKAVAFTSPVK